MALTREQSPFSIVSGIIIGLSVLFIFLAVLNRAQWWVTVLFSIPFIVQIRGIWILNKGFTSNAAKKAFGWFYLITMAMCLLSYCALWATYSSYERENNWLEPMTEAWATAPARFEVFSYLALFIITLLLLFVVRMTQAIIEGAVFGNRNSNRYNREIDRRWIRGRSLRFFFKLWDLNNLRIGASKKPFLTLVFFFTVFLGVSYLFGLALAFHDKVRPPGSPALYMSNLSSPFQPSEQTATLSPTPKPMGVPSEFTFRFIEGMASLPLPDVPEPNYSAVALNNKSTEATLKKDWRDASESNDSPQIKKSDVRDPESLSVKLQQREESLSDYLFVQLSPDTQLQLNKYESGSAIPDGLQVSISKDLNRLLTNPSLFEEERFKHIRLSPAARNLIKQSPKGEEDLKRLNRMLLAEGYSNEIAKTTFYELIQTIQGTADRLNRIRVTIVGYSDSSQIKGTSYQSNYELAEARAQNTKEEILKRLGGKSKDKSWDNIEWSCVSLSNEPSGSEKMVKVKLEAAPQDSASLLLKGEHPNPLTLLDYVYFANYTITTTGYGDIVPTTAYAKFICSFANIVEVFFLVVFFNVLVSLRRGSPKNLPLRHRDIERLAARIGSTQSTPDQDGSKTAQDDASNADLTKLKRRDSENRTRIKKIEAAIKEKADRVDIEAQVKEVLKRFAANPLKIFR